MYRKEQQRLEEEMASEMQQQHFFIQVGSLPVMATALSQLGSIYEKTKEYNVVIKYTLETAESGAKVVINTSKPVMDKLERPIESLNKVACTQLDKLKNNYPLITKPTDEVVSVTKAYCMKTVRPTLNRVGAAAQYSVDTYNSVTGYGKEKVDGVCTYTTNQWEGAKKTSQEKVGQVKGITMEMFTQALQTVLGQNMMKTVDGLLDSADNCVEYYLPLEKSEDGAEKPTLEVSRASTPATPLAKLGYVGNKARQRMYTRAMRNMRNLQLRSKETVENLNFTVNLIEFGRNNMSGLNEKLSSAKDKLADVWQQVNSEDKDDGTTEKNAEQKVISLARTLTQSLRGGLQTVASAAGFLPGMLQQKIQQARSYSEDVYENFAKAQKFEDIPAWLVQQTRETLGYIHETLDWLMEYTLTQSPLARLMPTYEFQFDFDWDDELEDDLVICNGPVTYVPVNPADLH